MSELNVTIGWSAVALTARTGETQCVVEGKGKLAGVFGNHLCIGGGIEHGTIGLLCFSASESLSRRSYRTVESYELVPGAWPIISLIRAGQQLRIGKLSPSLVAEWQRQLIAG